MTTIKLTYPVTHENKEYTELEMRRPTVRDHIWLDHKKIAAKREQKIIDQVENDAMMYARLTDTSMEVIGMLDMADWGKCRQFYLSCLNPSTDSSQSSETN